MLHRYSLGLFVLSVFLVSLRSAWAGPWTVVDLGATDAAEHGAWFGQPYWGIAINNSGNVAYTIGSQNFTFWPSAYFRAKGTSPATATTVALGGTDPNPANWSSDAFAINDNNIVVGDTYNTTENVNFNVAMAWKWNGSTGGTMVDLNTISGGPGADTTNGNSMYAINNNNQVTGYSNTYAANLGYPTALIENVTNAFGNSPSVTTTWLSRPGLGYTNAGGFGQSINSSGCVVMKGDRPNATQNAFYNGGTTSAISSWDIPIATSPGSGSIACWTSAINNNGLALCAAMPAVNLNAWVADTATVGGVATSTFDQYVPALVAGGTSFAAGINNLATPQVVGYVYPSLTDNNNSTNPQAIVWNYGAAAATSLNSYAAGLAAANLSGWNFQYAEGVNNNGEVVGYGTYNGTPSAFALLNYSGPGDANGDGKVDINDLTIVLANYNQTGLAWRQGCMDGDPTGTIDINDLTIVLSSYNTSYTYGSSAVGTAAVPEPGALALLSASLVGVLACAWRRRKQ